MLQLIHWFYSSTRLRSLVLDEIEGYDGLNWYRFSPGAYRKA